MLGGAERRAAGVLGDVARRHGRGDDDRLWARFATARMCVVADRGMISAETLPELEARQLLYIMGRAR